MKTLLDKLYKLRDNLRQGEFRGFSTPDRFESDEDEIDYDVINKNIDDAYWKGVADALNAAEDALQAILADYELEEMRQKNL